MKDEWGKLEGDGSDEEMDWGFGMGWTTTP